MAQNLTMDDELDEMPDFTDEPEAEPEEIPAIPAAPKKATGRKKAAYPRVVPKEFDIRAAHQAWKERNGIDDDYPW